VASLDTCGDSYVAFLLSAHLALPTVVLFYAYTCRWTIDYRRVHYVHPIPVTQTKTRSSIGDLEMTTKATADFTCASGRHG